MRLLCLRESAKGMFIIGRGLVGSRTWKQSHHQLGHGMSGIHSAQMIVNMGINVQSNFLNSFFSAIGSIPMP